MIELKTFDDIIFHGEGEGFKSMTGKSVVIDFYADWCAPCKASAPIVQKISTEIPEADFFKVDIVESPELATVFNIRSIPTFIVVTPEGQVAIRLGWETEDVFKKFIQNSITSNEEN